MREGERSKIFCTCFVLSGHSTYILPFRNVEIRNHIWIHVIRTGVQILFWVKSLKTWDLLQNLARLNGYSEFHVVKCNTINRNKYWFYMFEFGLILKKYYKLPVPIKEENALWYAWFSPCIPDNLDMYVVTYWHTWFLQLRR